MPSFGIRIGCGWARVGSNASICICNERSSCAMRIDRIDLCNDKVVCCAAHTHTRSLAATPIFPRATDTKNRISNGGLVGFGWLVDDNIRVACTLRILRHQIFHSFIQSFRFIHARHATASNTCSNVHLFIAQ